MSTFIYTSDDGVDFIGSNTMLGNTEIGLASEMYRETVLKRILEPIGRFYDYIILDCQPSIGIITINALAAADEIIIPVQANDFFCLDGLTNLMKYIKITQTHINPSLHIAGILITKYSAHTNISKLVCRTVYE
ncbi:MAG: AAA family ATPase, partial [Clostridiaceae bacterium]|nr:AAA family ATPase [Clostridiaceae bacterium]